MGAGMPFMARTGLAHCELTQRNSEGVSGQLVQPVLRSRQHVPLLLTQASLEHHVRISDMAACRQRKHPTLFQLYLNTRITVRTLMGHPYSSQQQPGDSPRRLKNVTLLPLCTSAHPLYCNTLPNACSGGRWDSDDPKPVTRRLAALHLTPASRQLLCVSGLASGGSNEAALCSDVGLARHLLPEVLEV